jgi:YbgC/YbaW family acyl-CoA thioester hydrolase
MELKSFYTVRFSDCDPFQHLNNARYLDYMINAREDHLKEFHGLDLAEFSKQGIGWVVSGHEIQYLKPACYNEGICIHSRLLEASENHLLVEVRMMDMKESHTKAVLWTRFSPISIVTGKRIPHPNEFYSFAQSVLQPVTETSIKERVTNLVAPKVA